jgi:hypothetical protein
MVVLLYLPVEFRKKVRAILSDLQMIGNTFFRLLLAF